MGPPPMGMMPPGMVPPGFPVPPQGMPMLPPRGMMPPPGMGMPMANMPPPALIHQIKSIKEEKLNPPNATIYVQNLNERIKPAEIKNALFQLFSNHGEVHEVHAKANIRMRG